MLRAFAIVALVTFSAGCLFCPECGCYPDSWNGQWVQPELADWARDNLDAKPAGDGLTFDMAAAGLPTDSALAHVTWVFGQGSYGEQRITLYADGDAVTFRYYYGADQNAADGAPKKAVLLAAVGDLLDTAWAGNESGRQEVVAAFDASWVNPHRHGQATARAPTGALPDSWDWDKPFLERSWEWPRPTQVGRQEAESGELRYGFRHATWAIETSEARPYEFIQVDGVGWASGGRVPGRVANETAIQDDIRGLMAGRGAPTPVFDRFEPVVQEICVD